MNAQQRESFERAFSLGISGSRGQCNCGKEFYDAANRWDWDAGEVEGLDQRGATSVHHSVSYVRIEGRQYVADCQCWAERGAKVVAFLENHQLEIANFLNLEKARKTAEANARPEVKT